MKTTCDVQHPSASIKRPLVSWVKVRFFTLVELLVVIAIIAILAAGIPADTAIAWEDLAPGESRTIDIPLTIAPEATWFFIKGTATGEGILSTFLHKTLGELVIPPELGAVTNPDDVAAAMSDIPWRPITSTMGDEVARTKLAFSGNTLLVHLQTGDRRILTNEDIPYNGSCVELFITPSEPDAKNALCQVFLIPSADRERLLLKRFRARRVVPEELSRGLCRPWGDEGYELCLIVPFETAKVPNDFGEFFLEIGINTDLGSAGGRRKMLAFNAPCAPASTEGCARIRRL